MPEGRRRPNRAPQFPDRVRFNWGYHDAAQDFTNPAFQVRNLVDRFDPQRPRTSQVSREQGAYYYGYREGLADAQAGAYTNDSQPAWGRVSGHPENLVFIGRQAEAARRKDCRI